MGKKRRRGHREEELILEVTQESVEVKANAAPKPDEVASGFRSSSSTSKSFISRRVNKGRGSYKLDGVDLELGVNDKDKEGDRLGQGLGDEREFLTDILENGDSDCDDASSGITVTTRKFKLNFRRRSCTT